MAAVARGEQRRALVIAGVGFGLVLALFLGSRLVIGDGGGGDESAEPTFPPTSAPQTTPGTPPVGAEPPEADAPVVAIPPVPESFEALELRDPFTPPLAVIEFLRSILPIPGEPGEPGQPGQPSPAPSNVVLRVIEVDNGQEVATLDVDGELFEASAGERFGPNGEFMVVSLDVGTQCGVFLFGDESFSLCVGQGAQPAPGTIPQK